MGHAENYASRWVRNARLIAPLALGVACADWLLKAGAIASGVPHQFHWLYERPPSPWLTLFALSWFAIMPGTLERQAGVVGLGLLCGAAIGNFGELAVFGHVTDFIPLPPGSRSSPADVLGVIGLVLLLGDVFLGKGGERRRATPPGPSGRPAGAGRAQS